MTGYGRGESMAFEWKCTVELKTVNHRYCDISIRIPPVMNPYEDRVRKILTREVQRGKLDVYIRVESFGQQPVKVEVNGGMADAYMKALHTMTKRYAVPDEPSLAMLASYPDVFMVDKTISDETRERIWSILEKALNEATEKLNEMRSAEGKALYADIMAKRMGLADLLRELKVRLPEAASDYEKRLQTRITEVLERLNLAEEPDEARLLIELAIYADRVCVDEELTRLDSHLTQLNLIMAEAKKSAVGRKLDFLVQELNREVNTIGSKSGDMVISKLVIDMKSEIEKIREQVQNVE